MVLKVYLFNVLQHFAHSVDFFGFSSMFWHVDAFPVH